MGRNIYLSLSFMLFSIVSIAQCTIDPFIQENYSFDAAILAIREINDDTLDPDYDNPFIPQERIDFYLEKLSAIYVAGDENVVINQFFDDFQIHVNPGYSNYAAYNAISFTVPTNTSWVDDFKNTGVSGNEALDQLVNTFQFSITNFIDLSSSGITIFLLESQFDYLNVVALIDDFEDVEAIDTAGAYSNFDFLNYTGIPYNIEGFSVEVCDLSNIDNTYTFFLGAGDCFAGCTSTEIWEVTVSPDCSQVLLSMTESLLQNVTIHPNPVSNNLYISGPNDGEMDILIYTSSGKLLQKRKNVDKYIDTSQWQAGIYFLKLTLQNGKSTTQKIIKN